MADHTHIEWTDATWNPITGCSVVSAGCKHCYAMKLAGTRLQHHASRAGLTIETKAGPVWTGEVRFNDEWLDQPLRWRQPRRIFVCAHGDLFHESVPDEWISTVFGIMAAAPWHTFQVLTKRPERALVWFRRMADMHTAQGYLHEAVKWRMGYSNPRRPAVNLSQWPLPNVWLGVSVEDQAAADERIPLLLQCPAAVRWISAEPLLGPVDLMATVYLTAKFGSYPFKGIGDEHRTKLLHMLDWVVAGGESGTSARPMHPDWARSLRDQCAAAGVPFLFKQWGAYVPDESAANLPWVDEKTDRSRDRVIDMQGWDCTNCVTEAMFRPFALMRHVGKKAAGRHLDGVLHDGYPEARS